MLKGFRLSLVLLMIPFILLGSGHGSKSLLHTQTASTLKPKRLDFGTNLNFFTKVGDFLGGQRPQNFTLTNYWDVQGNLLFSYGIAKNVDATVLLRLYQDVHQEGANFFNRKEYNVPDDVFINLKAGSFGVSNNRINLGTQVSIRLPISDKHNYPFEKYTAGGVELGFNGLFSYFNDPFIHERDLSFHINVGFLYYNDSGKLLYDDRIIGQVFSNTNSSSLEYAAGFSYPTDLFDLNLEVFGSTFISQPDSFAFSREDYLYVTPSIRYKPNWRYHIDLGMDIGLVGDTDESDPRASFAGDNLDLPNYVSWRLHLGFGVVLTAGNDKFGGVGKKADVKERVDFYQRLLQEREKTRSIEEELRRLKREREQAERELEELRQLLEEEGN